MRKSLPCLACLLALLLAGFAPGVSAWSNGGYSSDPNNPDYGTHDYLLEHALSMLPTAEKNAIVHNLSLALYGTEMPDNPDEIYDYYNHHIYYNSEGQLTDNAAATRAQEEYDLALAYLRSGDNNNADKRIGAMSHYITDPAVFGHVMGQYTDWGAEEHHTDDYEPYVRYRTTSYTSSDFDGYMVYDGSLTGMSASSAVTSLAYTTTFGSGNVKSCMWMDANYNWSSSTFKDSAGASMNLAANYLAEVLHKLYLDYTSAVTNNAPTLGSGSVSPTSGSSGATFTHEVTYTDADEDAPSYVKVYIDGTGYTMTKISGTYTGGALYRYTTSALSTGSHNYYFEASDGTGTARLPSSGTSSGPTVTEAENAPSENENVPSENENVLPDVAPFITLTFRKSDGTPLANTEIYCGFSSDQATHPLGTTDSQGKITSEDLDLGGQTVYFKSSDGTYAGSTYISSTGGDVSSTLTEITTPRGASEFPIWVIAVVVVACVVVGAIIFANRRRRGEEFEAWGPPPEKPSAPPPERPPAPPPSEPPIVPPIKIA